LDSNEKAMVVRMGYVQRPVWTIGNPG